MEIATKPTESIPKSIETASKSIGTKSREITPKSTSYTPKSTGYSQKSTGAIAKSILTTTKVTGAIPKSSEITSGSTTNDRTNSACGWGGTAILIKRSIPHYHVPTPPLLTGVKAALVALTPIDQKPFSVASIYAPPNPTYRDLGANLDAIFKTAILAGDYSAIHSSWGCFNSDLRGNHLLRYIPNNHLDLIAPPTPN
ncbi:hypothetical protein TNCV_3295761 [Trichonephila clavipes]|uniref:Endonuclease/exonuclease/phosphatase domain-containing protein n=1 Tax=Trichonephila clavipes TaxID=2585209 RepID=A0A8X6SXG7_TRICX|nr:hypothetical protein TNCV_3295761 [Trichonephila clavipes]